MEANHSNAGGDLGGGLGGLAAAQAARVGLRGGLCVGAWAEKNSRRPAIRRLTSRVPFGT